MALAARFIQRTAQAAITQPQMMFDARVFQDGEEPPRQRGQREERDQRQPVGIAVKLRGRETRKVMLKLRPKRAQSFRSGFVCAELDLTGGLRGERLVKPEAFFVISQAIDVRRQTDRFA